jgi:hypothetical protein
MNVGAIGCLQTLACIPVVAGDSIEVDLQGVFRLSPLRRNLYLDAKVDLFAFYVPHRHVYGDDWLTFIKSGIDEATTFGTETLQATTENHCLGTHLEVSTAVPKWVMHGYSQIWNRYFRNPSDDAPMADDFFDTDTSEKNLYGQVCCFDKRFWNSTIKAETDSSDKEVPVGNSGTTMDLTDFAKQQGRYKSELKREWFGQRYADIMKELYGSSINKDVEPYPELIMRNTNWLSGYDVDGTDDATLGTYSGKAVGVAGMRFPSKFFAEHGALWIMALVRFPPVIYWEQHYLTKPAQAEPTYKEISGDPDILANEPPMDLVDGDVWFQNSGSNALGRSPYGQWYREHPHFVHPNYLTVDGHPFLNYAPTTQATCAYHTSTLYDDIFSSLKLKHWQCQAHIGIKAKRVVPDPRTSIFAGTR